MVMRQHKIAGIKPNMSVNLININGLKSRLKEREYQMFDQAKDMYTIPRFYTVFVRVSLHMKAEDTEIEKTMLAKQKQVLRYEHQKKYNLRQKY